MASWLSESNREPQSGSIEKKWDVDELRRCGAIGTSAMHHPNLSGDIHPMLANWPGANPTLRIELHQPLLLASRLLESTAGLEWVSDFVVDDIFDERYPGRRAPREQNQHQQHRDTQHPTGSTIPPPPPPPTMPLSPPQAIIVRHHRAPWATAELRRSWAIEAAAELRRCGGASVSWQLDEEMLRARGWAGYTCRHPRLQGVGLDELDGPETVRAWDRWAREGERRRERALTLLLMAEYPARLRVLSRDGEEYLLTAFMAAVTMLHELAHAIYWRDFRAAVTGNGEPFYGSDLEMELGDSLVAHVFGGWIPVPIKETGAFRKQPTFDLGLAWRQHLSWDFHRLRPKHRAHYSIPVEYVARLFRQESWSSADSLDALIHPQSLSEYRHNLNADSILSQKGSHATAALRDFRPTGEGWRWNSRGCASFRIPQYDSCVWPDMALPVATDNVIEEPEARSYSFRPRSWKQAVASKGMQDNPGTPEHTQAGAVTSPEWSPKVTNQRASQRLSTSPLSKGDISSARLSYCLDSPSRVKSQMTVEELEKRLSRLIEVSMSEFDVLFDGF